MIRYAIVTTTSDRDNVAAYMPGNYEVIYSEPSRESFAREGWRSVVIAGEDNAGWTLDGYVLPRLASGMMTGHEIDLSHDIMKRVPDSTNDPATGPDLILPDGTRYEGRIPLDGDGKPIIDMATCGHCGFTWNDARITGITPTPSARCPNEYGHEYEEDVPDEPWADHEDYPVADWQYEVANGDTRLGYADWRSHKIT